MYDKRSGNRYKFSIIVFYCNAKWHSGKAKSRLAVQVEANQLPLRNLHPCAIFFKISRAIIVRCISLVPS